MQAVKLERIKEVSKNFKKKHQKNIKKNSKRKQNNTALQKKSTVNSKPEE